MDQAVVGTGPRGSLPTAGDVSSMGDPPVLRRTSRSLRYVWLSPRRDCLF
jgi:hypothetical protein